MSIIVRKDDLDYSYIVETYYDVGDRVYIISEDEIKECEIIQVDIPVNRNIVYVYNGNDEGVDYTQSVRDINEKVKYVVKEVDTESDITHVVDYKGIYLTYNDAYNRLIDIGPDGQPREITSELPSIKTKFNIGQTISFKYNDKIYYGKIKEIIIEKVKPTEDIGE